MLVLASGVFVQGALSKDTNNFVKNIIKEKGISEEDIQEINKVNFNNLPKQVDLKNIDETNLAIYEIKTKEAEPFYVLTVSDEKFKQTVQQYLNKMFLNFGYDSELVDSSFLKSVAGVQSSSENGYVMMREGSITGISTSLNVLKSNGFSEVSIIIYKNSEPVGFRNVVGFDSTGTYTDYDTISDEVITFEPGDVISVYVEINGDALIDNLINLVEINVK